MAAKKTRTCDECVHYGTKTEGTIADHLEACEDAEEEFGAIILKRDENGNILNLDEPFTFVDCKKGHYEDMDDPFWNYAKGCRDYKKK